MTVLVVIADPTLRQIVTWTLDELERESVLVPTWRAGVAALDRRPALAIYDLDQHPTTDYDGLLAVVSRGWGARVPLVVLSARADVERVAAEELDAVEGLRKPIVVGRLMEAVRRVIGE